MVVCPLTNVKSSKLKKLFQISQRNTVMSQICTSELVFASIFLGAHHIIARELCERSLQREGVWLWLRSLLGWRTRNNLAGEEFSI